MSTPNEPAASAEARPRLLPPAAHADLATAIGDTPCTVIPLHLLRRGLCRAVVAGPLPALAAAVVQSTIDPDAWPAREPTAFATDADALWVSLRALDGWDCVLVDQEAANALGNLIEADTGRAVRYYADVCHALTAPARVFRHDAVRLLTPDDEPVIHTAPDPEMRAGGWPSVGDLLHHGFAAGAVVERQLVAVAYTSARTPLHGDITVFTLPEWRGRGLVTAAASLVAQRLQRSGQTPVWDTGHDNWASLRVARKLGFTEAARRTFVIPQRAT
jgi:GNAT superfamily N-acetyltransferase